MKQINKYMLERLHITKDTANREYNYHPKTKDELKELIKKLTKERGNDADLNDINTSEITDMSYMFIYHNFNGDISDWDVNKVRYMIAIFDDSRLEKNPPKWYKK